MSDKSVSDKNIERMKKIIEEKKKKSSEQGVIGSEENKWTGTPTKGFKNTKRSGSLNK